MNHRADPQETQPRWWQTGKRPDYRFSLANERTFLAWIRTALALIAGAIAVDQFASGLNPPVRIALAALIAIAGGSIAALAYRRWMLTETAMRNDRDIPISASLPALAIFVAILGAALLVIVLFS